MTGKQELEAKIEADIQYKLRRLPKIFSEYYYDMKGDGKSYHTMERYLDHTVEFSRTIDPFLLPNTKFYETVTPARIKAYISEFSGETASIKWAAIRSFFTFLYVSEYLPSNPTDRVKRPKVRVEHPVTHLTEKEISDVLDNVKRLSKFYLQKRDIAIFTLFLTTGIRRGALVQLNVDDVDFTNHVINVVEKGNKVRQIPIGSSAEKAIAEWLNDRAMFFPKSDTDALFVTESGRITPDNIYKMVVRYTKCTGKHISPHKLRSTAATTLAAHDISPKTIQSILGHESVQTTFRYIAAMNKEKEDAINVLDSVIKEVNP